MVEDAPRNQILFFLLSIVLFCFFWWNFLFLYFLFYKLFLYLLMFVILFFWSITCRGMWERGRVGSNTLPYTSVPLAYQLSYVGGLLYFFFCHLGGEGGDRTPPLQATPSVFFWSKPRIIFLSTMFVILLG